MRRITSSGRVHGLFTKMGNHWDVDPQLFLHSSLGYDLLKQSLAHPRFHGSLSGISGEELVQDRPRRVCVFHAKLVL